MTQHQYVCERKTSTLHFCPIEAELIGLNEPEEIGGVCSHGPHVDGRLRPCVFLE
jgi:hypothetical protein